MFRRNTATTHLNKLMTRLMPILAACIFMFSAVAQGVPLGLSKDPGDSDIFSGFGFLDYAGNTLTTIAITPIEFNPGVLGILPGSLGWSYDLTATIDNTGTLSGGTLNVLGSISGLPGSPDGLLLSGDLTDFGFSATTNSVFEFSFDVTGGELAPQFFNFGSGGGIIMGTTVDASLGNPFNTDFTEFTTNSDTFGAPIPEPSSFLLFGLASLGMFGFGIMRRRKTKEQS